MAQGGRHGFSLSMQHDLGKATSFIIDVITNYECKYAAARI